MTKLNEQDVHADCPGCQWGDSVIEHVHDPANDPAPAECHEHDHTTETDDAFWTDYRSGEGE